MLFVTMLTYKIVGLTMSCGTVRINSFIISYLFHSWLNAYLLEHSLRQNASFIG